MIKNRYIAILFKSLLTCFSLFVLGLVGLWIYISTPHGRGYLSRYLSKALSNNALMVKIEGFQGNLLQTIKIDKLTLSSAPASQNTPPLLALEKLEVDWSLWDLVVNRKIAVDSIKISQSRVNFSPSNHKSTSSNKENSLSLLMITGLIEKISLRKLDIAKVYLGESGEDYLSCSGLLEPLDDGYRYNLSLKNSASAVIAKVGATYNRNNQSFKAFIHYNDTAGYIRNFVSKAAPEYLKLATAQVSLELGGVKTNWTGRLQGRVNNITFNQRLTGSASNGDGLLINVAGPIAILNEDNKPSKGHKLFDGCKGHSVYLSLQGLFSKKMITLKNLTLKDDGKLGAMLIEADGNYDMSSRIFAVRSRGNFKDLSLVQSLWPKTAVLKITKPLAFKMGVQGMIGLEESDYQIFCGMMDLDAQAITVGSVKLSKAKALANWQGSLTDGLQWTSLGSANKEEIRKEKDGAAIPIEWKLGGRVIHVKGNVASKLLSANTVNPQSGKGESQSSQISVNFTKESFVNYGLWRGNFSEDILSSGEKRHTLLIRRGENFAGSLGYSIVLDEGGGSFSGQFLSHNQGNVLGSSILTGQQFALKLDVLTKEWGLDFRGKLGALGEEVSFNAQYVGSSKEPLPPKITGHLSGQLEGALGLKIKEFTGNWVVNLDGAGALLEARLNLKNLRAGTFSAEEGLISLSNIAISGPSFGAGDVEVALRSKKKQASIEAHGRYNGAYKGAPYNLSLRGMLGPQVIVNSNDLCVKNGVILGSITYEIPALDALLPFVAFKLHGKSSGSIKFAPNEWQSNCECKYLRIKDFYINDLRINLDKGLDERVRGELTAMGVAFKDLYLAKLQLTLGEDQLTGSANPEPSAQTASQVIDQNMYKNTDNKQQSWQLIAQGPSFVLRALGHWNLGASPFIGVETINGVVHGYDLDLKRPCYIEGLQGAWSHSPFDIALGNGFIQGKYNAKSNTRSYIFDFDSKVLFSMLLDKPVDGRVSGSIVAKASEKSNVRAEVKLDRIKLNNGTNKLLTSNAQLTYEAGVSHITAQISTGDENFSSHLCKGAGSFTYNEKHKRWEEGQLIFDGALDLSVLQLAAALDFYDTKGIVTGNSKVIYDKTSGFAFKGNMKLTGGMFHWPDKGVMLNNVIMSLRGDGKNLYATMEADDGLKGSVASDWEIKLEDLPIITSRISFANFILFRSATLKAMFSGDASFSYNESGAKIVAQLTAESAEYLIGGLWTGRLPLVEYKEKLALKDRANTAPTQSGAADKFGRATALDIAVKIPGNIHIKGDGINSYWSGALGIKGFLRNPILSGQVNLIRGSYTLGGQEIKFNKGIVLFAGNQGPSVDLEGSFRNQEIRATIIVSSRAGRWWVKMESDPYFPQDEILSRILFGKNLGSISFAQGLKLAYMMQAFSGKGLNVFGVMEKLNNSLGLDVLSFKETYNSESNNESLALSIGKHITDKLYISLDQDINGSNSSLNVEFNITPALSVESNFGTKIGAGFNWQWSY